MTQYKRYGLPMPPADAELVRVPWYVNSKEPDVLVIPRCPSAKADESPSFLVGVKRDNLYQRFTLLPPVEQTPEAMREVSPLAGDFLPLAIQCKILGWDALAHGLYAAFLADRFAEYEKVASDPERRGFTTRDRPEWLVCAEAGTLWGIAWSYWDSQVIEAGSDRGLLLRRLKALYEEDPRFQTLARKYLLEHLELTVAPLKAKPGTPEALIDALTEYNGAGESFVPDGPYLSLVELGFDAVPALIEHLQDPRFTRRETGMFNNFRPYRVRVGHLVSGILDGLADGELEVWGLRGDMADPEVALRWWARLARSVRKRGC